TLASNPWSCTTAAPAARPKRAPQASTTTASTTDTTTRRTTTRTDRRTRTSHGRGTRGGRRHPPVGVRPGDACRVFHAVPPPVNTYPGRTGGRFAHLGVRNHRQFAKGGDRTTTPATVFVMK